MVAGSVFIDEVTVTPILLGEPVKLANPSFDAADRGSKDYKYIIPRGWRGTGAIVVKSGSSAWGGLKAPSGENYLSLQGLGSHIHQPISGLVKGKTYVVRFSMADRPGYGEDESLHVKIDNNVIWESTHPDDGFNAYSAIFTATRTRSMLTFENDSPEGDRSIFIDGVSITQTRNAVSVILPSSSADKQPFDFQLLTKRMTFDAAQAECKARNRQLASIHSMKENAWVAALHHPLDTHIYDGIWLGLHDSRDGRKSPWKWVDGTSYDFHNWGPEEPNNGRTHGSCDKKPRKGCGENCAIMSAHLSTWTDHKNSGGGADGKTGRKDYQWNDGGCNSKEQAVCGPPTRRGSRSLLAYYSFDYQNAKDSSGNHRDGQIVGNGVSFSTHGVSGSCAVFDGHSKIEISAFRNWAWGDKFAVSVWFMRDPSARGNYQGIVNNGYWKHGSFEIRMGREMGGTMLGGGVVTTGHDEAWGKRDNTNQQQPLPIIH